MKRNPWPYAIIAYFIIFISSMVSWVVFAVHNEQELVRTDYYEQELKFQTEIERLTRAASAPFKINYQSATQNLAISLPSDASKASLHFYRPSKSSLDRTLKLTLKEGHQTLDLRDFSPGLWKLHFTWTAKEVEFSRHESLILLAL